MNPQHRTLSLDAGLRRLLAWSALAIGLLVGTGWPLPANAMRIKEIAAVQGVRTNQLTGFGLVVGLDGTGDQTTQMPYTSQGMNNYLQQLGLTLPADAKVQMKNVAAVMVTAQLPPFAQPGQMIDVTVSSMGNAKSLRGGTLITTPLKGADGEIYALAQGNLLVGGAGASGGGSKVQINHLSAGRIPSGAQVERAVPTSFAFGDTIDLGLNSADFQTARRVAQAINERMGAGVPRQPGGLRQDAPGPRAPGDVRDLGGQGRRQVRVGSGEAGQDEESQVQVGRSQVDEPADGGDRRLLAPADAVGHQPQQVDPDGAARHAEPPTASRYAWTVAVAVLAQVKVAAWRRAASRRRAARSPTLATCRPIPMT